MSIADKYNSGQSDSQINTDNYGFNFGTSASTFRTNIQNKLTSIGSPLTPIQIMARANALSCGGCHQLTNGANPGDGLIWPASLGFVHVSESSVDRQADQIEGARFGISPALTDVFLPPAGRLRLPGQALRSPSTAAAAGAGRGSLST